MTKSRDIADSINRIDSSAADATAMTIDANENVGIGTSSPSAPLEISTSSGDALKVTTSTGRADIWLTDTDTTAGQVRLRGDANNLVFITNTTERMRIDSSGNLLVGQTTANSNAAGIGALPYGSLYSTRDGGSSLLLNRKTSDGDIAVFQKDGSTVGSIGTSGSYIHIGSDSVQQTYIGFNNNYVYPSNNAGGFKDNAIDLGNGSARFDDVYATNGTIQTSDQNEKQQIATLTDAEIAAAKRISNGFKTFKWNDAVAAKGDNARTHTGVIAQEVRTALEAEGLDAGNYAFFMSNTWWETQTDVPAVAAVAEVLDDDGNVVTEAVEAQDAYTRTDIYDTAEEAPEGATERTRLGVRYPELLAFVGAATEQRLTSIEARLTALEA